MSKRPYEVSIPADAGGNPIEFGVLWANDVEQAKTVAIRREWGQTGAPATETYRQMMHVTHRSDLEEGKARHFVVFAHFEEETEYVGLYRCLHPDAALEMALEEPALAVYPYAEIRSLLQAVGVDHELRSDPTNYELVQSGAKTYEIRSNEKKQMQQGQVVMLREWSRDGAFEGRQYSGRQHVARVGHVSDYRQQAGYVVFSLVSIL